MHPLKILSLSCVYPNQAEPHCGLFIRARLSAMASLAPLRVMAPVSLGRGVNGVLRRERDGVLDVLRPPWVYPPGGGCLNPVALAAALVAPLRSLRRTFPFDLIDAHFGHPDGIAAALLAAVFGCPFSVTLRGSEVEHARYPLRRIGMSWALRRAARVVAVSENLHRFALSLGVEPARVRTIPNGVDLNIFHPRDRTGSRAQFGIPVDVPVIVSAGHLIELKGHHRIAAALGDLPASTRLLIAGDSGRGRSYEPEIRAAAAEAGAAGRVLFLGALPPQRLAALMCAADVLCLASSREGCPNVVNEALACGTPVVATAVGGVPERLASGNHGLVVPAGDDRALAKALGIALHRKWDRDAVAEWGASRSWNATGRDVIAFFGDLAIDRHGVRGELPVHGTALTQHDTP